MRKDKNVDLVHAEPIDEESLIDLTSTEENDTEAEAEQSENPSEANSVRPGRKPKLSKIAPDYNPVPDPYPIPKGHERPTLRCHVSQTLVREIEQSELSVFAGDPSGLSTIDRKFRFLASQVVSVGGECYVRDKSTGAWRIRKKGEVKACLRQDWFGEKTLLHIGLETVDRFFAENRFLVLDQTIYVPSAGPFVEFQGRRCLNTWFQPPISYDPTNLGSEECGLLLRVIQENLLCQKPRPTAEIFDEIMGNERTPLRFLFHWLASLYQRPGCHLPTTIWLIGSQQGVGKGLCMSALKVILGTDNVRQVNLGELRGEWNDFIQGTQLLIGDEIKLDSKKDFYDMMKRYVGSPTVALRKRNVGQYEVPNVANWIFTTNAVRPVTIEPDDRRNVFIATTERADARVLVDQFFRLSEQCKRRAYEGLAALLGAIQIDQAFISTAISTPLKEQLSELSEKPFQMWLRSDFAEELWPMGSFTTSETILSTYRGWAEENQVYSGQRSLSSIEEQLAELQKKSQVSAKLRKRLPDGTRPYGYVRLDPADPEQSLQAGLHEEPRNARAADRLQAIRRYKAGADRLRLVKK